MKRLTDLAIQLSQLYRHGDAIGVKFETIADHLSVHVSVKGTDLRYRYINLPGQVQRLLPSALSGQVSDADLLGADVGQRVAAEDRRALSSAAPLVLWSEPQPLADGRTERIAQVKLGLRSDQGQALGVLDVVPMTDAQAPQAALEVMRMNQALDLITHILGLMMRCQNEAALIERVCSTLVVRGGYLAAAIVPIDADRRLAGVPLSLAGDRSELALPGPFRLDDTLWEGHPVARAAEAGICVVHRAHPQDDVSPWRLACPTHSAQALIALPLKTDDDVNAVVLMACDGLDGVAPSRVMLLQRMAEELSLGLELLRSRERLASERHQRDIHLREQLLTSQRLSLATESADVGLWEWDLARGTLTMDERVLAQHGLPSATRTLPAATLRDWLHADDRAVLNDAVASVVRHGQTIDITVRSTPPDGRLRRLRLHMLPLRVSSAPEHGHIVGILGTCQDVSDNAQRAQRIQDLDAKLRLATQATGLGLWELDLEDDCLLLDSRTAQIYGLDAGTGSITLASWLSWVHPGQRQDVAARLRDSRQQATIGQVECAVTPPDGQLRRVLINWASQADDSGLVTQLVGTKVDVTERRRDEARAAQTRQRLALMSGSTGVGQWRYDLRDGFSFDEAMFRLLGSPSAPHPAAAWLMEMCLPVDQREALELALITADEQLEVSLQWQGLDGISRQVIWMGTVEHDARRTVIHGEGLCIDVTVQQQVYAARHALQPGTAASLAARVSHELRSPLNAMLGFVQLLRQTSSGQGSSQQEQYLAQVEQSGWHLLELVNDAVDLSRIQSGATPVDLQAVSLVDLMGEVLPFLEQQASTRNVRIELDALAAWPSVVADRSLLKQSLLSLGGLALHRSPPDSRLSLTFSRQGPQVHLRLQDEGLVPEEALYMTSAEPLGAPLGDLPGSGMRLTVARRSIEAMQGQVQVVATPGLGTTLIVTLRAAAQAPTSRQTMTPSSPARLPQRPVAMDKTLQGRILYVEDNPSNVLLVRECLSLRPGVELLTASNVQEGLTAIQGERYDLILLDLQLPDGDGYAVLKRLREQRGRHTPCVALTANAMLNERNRALEAGFDEFWTKPLNLPEFLLGLERWLTRQPQQH